MFNSSHDYFTSSPGLIFNRQNHPARYHPYDRIATSYYPINELETYSFDKTNSIENYDYNLPWSSAVPIENQPPGRLKFCLFKSTEHFIS
jgi:hypothetical protein